MPIDPSIILSGRQAPQPDIGETLGRVLSIRAMQQEAVTRDQQQQLQRATLAEDARKLKAEQDAAATDKGTKAAVAGGWTQGADGAFTLDRNAVTQGLLEVPGADVSAVLGHLDAADKQKADAVKAQSDAEEAQQKANAIKLTIGGSIANAVKAANYAPGAYVAGVHDLLQNKLITPEQAQQHLAVLTQGPDALKQVVDHYIARSDEQRKLGVSESEAATKAAAEAKPKSVTGPELDDAAQQLLTKRNMGQRLTPLETAQLNAYDERKRTTTDATISAADARLKQTEAFQRQEAGRGVLSKDVEKPFVDSKEKADLLRDVVRGAQHGNLTAAALQTLTTTLGLTSAEGVKRINAVELGQVAGAGSLWDRLKGRVGGLVAGQPIDAKLQKDTLDLADMLEHSAAKKYLTAHESTTKRYGLTDEQPLSEAVTAVQSEARRRAASVLSGAGKTSDDAAIDRFLKNNPSFK